MYSNLHLPDAKNHTKFAPQDIPIIGWRRIALATLAWISVLWLVFMPFVTEDHISIIVLITVTILQSYIFYYIIWVSFYAFKGISACEKRVEHLDRLITNGIEHISFLRHEEDGTINSDEETVDGLTLKSLVHFVILPNYKENEETLSAGIESIKNQSIGASKSIVLVLAMEFAEQKSLEKALYLRQLYKNDFLDIIISVHKLGSVPGEQAGKSANVSYALRLLLNLTNAQRKEDDSNKIENKQSRDYWISHFYNRGIITVTDADSMFHPHHFLDLSLKYLESNTIKKYTTIWQAPISSYANFYELPGLVRIAALAALNEMATLACDWDERLGYSTYSMSTQLAIKADGWAVDVVAEDWHCFLRCFFATSGNTGVERISTPVINYSVESEDGDSWKTIKERYNQIVRHFWGVTEIAYAISYFMLLRNNNLPLNNFRFFRVVWKMFTNSFLNLQFFAAMAALVVLFRHSHVTIENTVPFNFILYQILHFTTTKLPFLGIFVILAHFRYEVFFSRVWKKYENSHLEAASLIHNQQNNNSISKTFVDYIPLLKNLTIMNRLKFTIEFFILSGVTSIVYQALPSLHAFSKLLMSPYFVYRVAAKPKL